MGKCVAWSYIERARHLYYCKDCYDERHKQKMDTNVDFNEAISQTNITIILRQAIKHAMLENASAR